MTAAGPRVTIRTRILACIEEEPGSTGTDIRAMLAEQGARVSAEDVGSHLHKLVTAGLVERQSMPTGGRPVYCYRLPAEVS